VTTSLLAVCAIAACGGSAEQERESTNGESASIEDTCHKLESVACIASGFDACEATLRDLVDTAGELDCAAEVAAFHTCLGETPNFTCEGDAARYNGSCDAERQTLENCQRRHPDYCSEQFGGGSCLACLCVTCSCDETCVAGGSASLTCAAECTDSTCAEQCVVGSYADYLDCQNMAMDAVCADVCP
jgi:hypothetical protein